MENRGGNPFAYRVNKEQKVFLFWFGKQVLILSGQLIMAKVTENFKPGLFTEKDGKNGEI